MTKLHIMSTFTDNFELKLLMKETNFTIKLRKNKKGCVNVTCSFSSVLAANKNLCLGCNV